MQNSEKTIQRKYSISDYDPNWIVKFQSIRNFVSEVFRSKALQIEHIGSTSIPGMKAKPIIDVLIVTKDVRDLSQETLKMVAAGYEWTENYIAPDSIIFFKADSYGEKLENIHVFLENAPKVKQFLIMRDFFRMFPEKAKAYSDLKEANAQKYPDDYLAYRAAKKPFLNAIEKEAYEWAEGRNY